MDRILSLRGVILFGVAATAGLAASWVRRELVLVTVVGNSMHPTYRSGEKVVICRSRRARIATGDVIVVERPDLDDGWGDRPLSDAVDDRGWLLKRVMAVAGDSVPAAVRDIVPGHPRVPAGSLVVMGDNARSLDSRRVGFFPADRVLGVVVRPKRPAI